MHLTTYSMHHAARGALPVRSARMPAASAVGHRLLNCWSAPAPRAMHRARPAWGNMQQRHYAPGTPVDNASVLEVAPGATSRAKHCGFDPAQVQQVLWRCKGMGFRVIAAPAGAQADIFKGVLAMCFDYQAAAHAHDSRAESQGLAPWPWPYDPDMEHGTTRSGAVMLFVNGRREIHSRNVPLNYLVLAEKAWAITVAGTDPAASEQDRVSCAKISFPANSLVQLSLVKGMLHGFEGRFGAVCAGVAHPGGDWPWSQALSTPRWAEREPAKVHPEKVELIGDRPVPWNVVQEWQSTVAFERSPESIAWEMARMHAPV